MFEMKEKIQYGKQYINREDIKSVTKCLREDLLTTGPQVKKFEKKIEDKLGCKYAVTCNNGTSGLHLALKAIGTKKNDVILMPSINFIASFNMTNEIGARSYLVDVDAHTGQMTEQTILECIKKNKIKKIKAIITMYLGGYVTDNVKFYLLKKKLKCFLIEDACHALGAKYQFEKKKISIGSCRHSDVAVFSFHPVKSITTGEGGVVTTNSKNIFQKLKIYKNHGIIRKKNKYWNYDIKSSGYNYRLSDINCSLGISQLNKLDTFISKRKKIFLYYQRKLKNYKSIVTLINNHNPHNAYHLIILNINFKILKSNKEKLFNFLNKKSIYPQFHYIPIYKFSLCAQKYNARHFKGSEEYYKSCISLPVYYSLTKKQMSHVINKIIEFINSKFN